MRNHSFELVAATTNTFLELSGLSAEFVYSSYDDSFGEYKSFSDTDVLVFWIDLARYSSENLCLVSEQIETIVRQTRVPSIVAMIGGQLEFSSIVNRVSFEDIEALLGLEFFDDRLADFAGTRLSAQACLQISRRLGLQVIPAAVKPGLKALIVDLDNTLYSGVLGEDGPRGIRLKDGHFMLQSELHRLSSQGFFVCVVSKNDEVDVEELFSLRDDFPLRRKDVTKIVANWKHKSENIKSLEVYLNIHHTSFLFIDDNLGELTEVGIALPGIQLLWASSDAHANHRALKNFPGLLKMTSSMEDTVRKADILANEQRRLLRAELSQEDYLRSLDIEIEFNVNNTTQFPRVAELSRKTNQFIFGYKRYSDLALNEIANRGDAAIVAISMRDRLLDSGVIGSVIALKRDDHLIVEDVFVSCRALGRGLDETIVLGAITRATEELKCDRVLVCFQKGERNKPAEMFVSQHLREQRCKPSTFEAWIASPLVRVVQV
jgi:FkbH-like protein